MIQTHKISKQERMLQHSTLKTNVALIYLKKIFKNLFYDVDFTRRENFRFTVTSILTPFRKTYRGAFIFYFPHTPSPFWNKPLMMRLLVTCYNNHLVFHGFFCTVADVRAIVLWFLFFFVWRDFLFSVLFFVIFAVSNPEGGTLFFLKKRGKVRGFFEKEKKSG